MSTDQYIPPSVNNFDFNYHGKGYATNQHMVDHNFVQSEPFVQFRTNSYPSDAYGLNLAQSQLTNEPRFVQNNVQSLGEPRNSQAVNMTTEPYTSGAFNYTTSDVCGMNYTQQERNIIQNEVLPLGSKHCGNRQVKKEKHTRERTFVCDVCGRRFFEMSSLTVHSRLHSGERPFSCEVCDKTFASKEGLRSHLVVHSDARPFPCDLCDKKFSRKQQMQHHRLIHTGEKPHICQVCQRGFMLPRMLKRHMISHTDDRPYPCDQCDKKFKTPKQLKIHKKFLHSNERPFACEFCPLRFVVRSNLKKHLRVHTGEKPYHCQYCPNKYSNKDSFLNHIRIHEELNDSQTVDLRQNNTSPMVENPQNLQQSSVTSQKQCTCVICKKEFTDQRDFEKHRLHHKRDKPFACFICGVRFFRSPNLQLHLSLIHNSTSNSCQICNKNFQSKNLLVDHIQFHLSECESYKRNQKLKIESKVKYSRVHKKLIHSRRSLFPCYRCGRTFNSRYHFQKHMISHFMGKGNASERKGRMQVNTVKKPYACPICHAKTSKKDSFVRHVCSHSDEQGNLKMAEMSSEEHSSDEELSDVHSQVDLQSSFKKTQGQFACDQCEKTFEKPQYLNRHKRRIHSTRTKKPYQCIVCSKSFSQSSDLRRHTLVHTEERPYGCNLCHKRYRRKKTLADHYCTQVIGNFQISLQRNAGMSSDQDSPDEEVEFACYQFKKTYDMLKKPHQCIVCSKRFRYRYHLRRHAAVHSAEKPYVCKICHKGYACKDSLTRHFNDQHSNAQMEKKSSDQDVLDEENISLSALMEKIMKEKKKDI